jgi:hypothetical protein
MRILDHVVVICHDIDERGMVYGVLKSMADTGSAASVAQERHCKLCKVCHIDVGLAPRSGCPQRWSCVQPTLLAIRFLMPHPACTYCTACL